MAAEWREAREGLRAGPWTERTINERTAPLHRKSKSGIVAQDVLCRWLKYRDYCAHNTFCIAVTHFHFLCGNGVIASRQLACGRVGRRVRDTETFDPPKKAYLLSLYWQIYAFHGRPKIG